MIARLCSGAALALALGGCATIPSPPSTPVEVAVIGINDFHGNLEPPARSIDTPDGQGGTIKVPAGGVAYLANAIDALRAKHANTVVVSAGDMIGASPIASALFLDEPSILAMNAIGVEFNALGNHEFDRGRNEVLRIQRGGCEKNTLREPCALEPFPGAKFQQLAANTFTEGGATLLPASGLKTFGSGPRAVTVGFIGATTRSTGELVSPGGIAGLTFADEAEAINRQVPALKAAGADAIVVLIHEGGATDVGYNDKSCSGLSGAILPILDRLDPAVDVVVSGHTHKSYVCDYARGVSGKPVLLTSAGVAGTLVTEIVLSIDPATGTVVSRRADNHIVQSEAFSSSRGTVANSDSVPRYTARADIKALVDRYVAAAKTVADRPVGRISGPGERGDDAGLGKMIADAQLLATRDAGAQIAFMNPFGIRTDLIPTSQGVVTYGQIFAVQPFNNTLVTMTLTGAQIITAIEQGLDDPATRQALAPSAGFSYRYDLAKPAGSHVIAAMFDGKPIDPAARYRVTVNSFLAGGGDGYGVFAQGTDRVVGASDLDAFELWLEGAAIRQVPQEPRATGQ